MGKLKTDKDKYYCVIDCAFLTLMPKYRKKEMICMRCGIFFTGEDGMLVTLTDIDADEDDEDKSVSTIVCGEKCAALFRTEVHGQC